jgi:hypothetical protein
MKQKGFAGIIFLILVALAIVGYFGYAKLKSTDQLIIQPTSLSSPTPDPTADWKT